jgi:hypothetical protein
VPRLERHLYPGAGHLFADAAAPEYDADSARLMTSRVLAFLSRISPSSASSSPAGSP